MIIFVVFALIITLNTLVLYLYLFFRNAHSFFEKKHFATLKPKFIVGNFGDLITMKTNLALCLSDMYKRLEPHKYAGFYGLHRPAVLIRDPELIKNILVRDFDIFRNRALEFKDGVEPLHHNLLRMSGDEWKNARMKLNPFFSLAKMKTMFQTMQQCANNLGKVLDLTNGEPFDIKILCEQFTIDTIGRCAFGVDFSAMEDPNCIIRQMARRIFKFRFQTILRHAIPKPPKCLFKIFDLSYTDGEVDEFFTIMMTEAINLRKRNPNIGNDLLTILLSKKPKNMEGNTNSDEEQVHQDNEHFDLDDDETTMEFKIAQCYLFFSAGFETTSTALAYIMMELALNKSIQNKVREEIVETLEKYNGQITWDSVKEMTYIDMVIEEGLRLHPPAAVLGRISSEPYQIPDTKVIIPQQMAIAIPVYGVHTDPKYYENPNKFYPEHFTKEAKSNRPSCAFIPFGEGPRNCIAARFATIEIKLGIVNMIKNYVLEISPKMKFPLEYAYEMRLGLLAPRNGIWLQSKKYEKNTSFVNRHAEGVQPNF